MTILTMVMPMNKVPVIVKVGNIPQMLVFVYLNEVNLMNRFEKIIILYSKIQKNTSYLKKGKKILIYHRR